MGCPNCDCPVTGGDRFCMHCGIELVTCADCGAVLLEGKKFCGKCGSSVIGEADPGSRRHEPRSSRAHPDAVEHERPSPPAEGASPVPVRRPLLGMVAKSLGVVLIVFAIGVWASQRRSISSPSGGPGWELVLAAMVAGGVGSWLFLRGKQLGAKSADDLLAEDPRPPILYLRAFKDDAATARQHGGAGTPFAFNSEEEQLADVFNEVGPFVAVGRPGEKLPGLGAARVYVGDDRWRQKVSELMERARLVVFRAGATEGLWWEIRQAARRLHPAQLLFLVPFGKDEYDDFRKEAEQSLRLRFPDHPGARKTAGSLEGLVYFDADGQPGFATFERKLFRTGTLNPIASMVRRALQPVFQANGIEWRSESINWWVVYLSFIIGSGVITLVFLLLALALGWIEP